MKSNVTPDTVRALGSHVIHHVLRRVYARDPLSRHTMGQQSEEAPLRALTDAPDAGLSSLIPSIRAKIRQLDEGTLDPPRTRSGSLTELESIVVPWTSTPVAIEGQPS